MKRTSAALRAVRIAQYHLWQIAKHKGVPKKVDEIAHAIERDQNESPEVAHRIAWESYCSYVNPSYDGCTSKGKSKRKSPESEYSK